MFKPTSDRLDYSSLLAPPDGHEVVAAVGTTYSLDLDALVGICIALGLAVSTDSQMMNNPVYLLEALRKTADKVVLFCEAGQIHVPTNRSSLYILLEKMVYEVQVHKQAKAPIYPSFHPKFWLIKYQDTAGNIKYRTVILSRNLTFDRSWDVSVCLDGAPGGENTQNSQPIRDFLNYLMGFLRESDENSKAKRKLINGMAREIMDVTFEADDKMFTEFEFIPVGVKNEQGERYSMQDTSIFADTFHEALIMSPFLSASVIEEFNKRNTNIENPECTLITRRASLEKLKSSQCEKFKIYTMKDEIVYGESALSYDSEDLRKQDIHAKLYLWRKYSNSELYLGSFNASYSAMHGNIEFMLRLRSKNRYLNSAILTRDLFNGDPDNKDNPFELTELPTNIEVTSDEGDILQDRIKALCRSKPRAAVKENNGKFDLEINFENLGDVTGLFISPLLSKKTVAIASTVTIEGLDLLQISEFYSVTATGEETSVSRVIKIVTDNLPANRESAVFTSVIKDQQGFIQYVAFLLGDDYLLALVEANYLDKSTFLCQGNSAPMPALYERMLKVAATTPERFAGIEYLLKMITAEGVIPDGFAELYDTFRKVVGLSDRYSH